MEIDMNTVKVVSIENLHKTIIEFINNSQLVISEYEDIKECILKMMRARYFFNMDRDRLRDAMEDITFSLCPGDDINKDRVSRGLEYDYSDEELDGGEHDDDDDDDDDEGLVNSNESLEVS